MSDDETDHDSLMNMSLGLHPRGVRLSADLNISLESGLARVYDINSNGDSRMTRNDSLLQAEGSYEDLVLSRKTQQAAEDLRLQKMRAERQEAQNNRPVPPHLAAKEMSRDQLPTRRDLALHVNFIQSQLETHKFNNKKWRMQNERIMSIPY